MQKEVGLQQTVFEVPHSIVQSIPKLQHPLNPSVHALFEDVVRRSPDALALRLGSMSVKYSELNEMANRVAQLLMAEGIGRGSIVGICFYRSIEMIAAMLGILKAGAAYAPFDPDYPIDRIAFMLEDSGVRLMLSHSAAEHNTSNYGIAYLNIDTLVELRDYPSSNLNLTSAADDLAYVMYTSGSTGQPKGACIPHRGIVRLVIDTNYILIDRHDVFLQFASISFDASTFEIWGALLNGSTLTIMPPGIPTLSELGEQIQKCHVTVLWLTSPLFQLMVNEEPESLKGLRCLLTGGDVVPGASARRFLQLADGCTLINGYGPTEATTFACCHVMTKWDDIPDTLPIGKPISKTQIYILDAHGASLPDGSTGELYIGGDGLAIGYFNRPELTKAMFCYPLVDAPDVRLYKTGDTALMRPDGIIEFLGRGDDQVKIRGYRVELREIENVLRKSVHVHQAIVVLSPGGSLERQIIACVVTDKSASVTERILRDQLASQLPAHCMPNVFYFVDSLPLTPNGKVDKELLIHDALKCRSQIDACGVPVTELEWVLSDIWKNLFGLDKVGKDDNFFQLGGDSLKAIRLLAQINNRLHIKAPMALIMEAPTVTRLAFELARLRERKELPSLTALTEGNKGIPLFCFYRLDGLSIGYQDLANALGPDRPVYGLTDPAWSTHSARTEITLEQIASECAHEIRTLSGNGPYMLAGSSFGGVLAYEVAQQLIASGGAVDLLILLDAFAPAALRSRKPKSKISKLVTHVRSMKQMSVQELKVFLLAKFFSRYKKAKVNRGTDGLEFESMDGLLDAIQLTNIKALWSYNPVACPCRKVVIRSKERNPFREDSDPKLWWGDLIDSSEIEEAAGDHVSILHSQFVAGTAKLIQKHICSGAMVN